MHMIKVILSTTIIMWLTSTGLCYADSRTLGMQESESFAVEVSGQVPGFTQAQLSSYLTKKMQDETSSRWHFVEGMSGSDSFPNRVVWLFKPLRKVTKSRGFMGAPGQTSSITYLKTEVKLYVKGSYQMTFDAHPSVSNEADDKVLSEMVRNVTHILFVDNNLDMK